MSAQAKPTDDPFGLPPVPTPRTVADGNIFQRLNRVMLAVSYIQKEKKQGMRYSIVSHDAVTAAVRPYMVGNGVIYYPVNLALDQNGNRTEARLVVRFQNVDHPDDFFDVPSAGYGIDDQDKGPGKAISYAVKYALLKALGLESGDDPDNDQTTTHKTAIAINAQREFELQLEEADDVEALSKLDKAVRKDYRDNILDKATANQMIGKIKAKVKELTPEE